MFELIIEVHCLVRMYWESFAVGRALGIFCVDE
jgi:hypothetical protein